MPARVVVVAVVVVVVVVVVVRPTGGTLQKIPVYPFTHVHVAMLYEICEQTPPFRQIPVKQSAKFAVLVTEVVVVVTDVANWHVLPLKPVGQSQVARMLHVPPFRQPD